VTPFSKQVGITSVIENIHLIDYLNIDASCWILKRMSGGQGFGYAH